MLVTGSLDPARKPGQMHALRFACKNGPTLIEPESISPVCAEFQRAGGIAIRCGE